MKINTYYLQINHVMANSQINVIPNSALKGLLLKTTAGVHKHISFIVTKYI